MGSSIPLPALDVKVPAQQPGPIDELARIMQIKGLQQNQALGQAQLQGVQTENQTRQLQLQQAQLESQDDRTWRSALQDPNWDGSPEQLKKNALKQGVGIKSYQAVSQGLAATGEVYAKLGSEQLKVQEGLADHIGDQLQAVQDAKPADKLTSQQVAKHNAISYITSTPGIHPLVRQEFLKQIQQIPDDQYVGDDTLSDLIGHNKLHSALVDEGLKTAQTGEAAQKANQAQADAALANIKVNLSKNSKAGDFDAQIDQMMPQKGPNAALGQITKTMVNASLSRGDFEGAQKTLQASYNQIGEINKETNPSVQMARANQAAMTAKTVEPLRQDILSTFQNNKDARDKIETTVLKPYQDKMSQIGELQSAVSQAQSGNVAAARATLYKVIGVAQPQGTHRVAPTEVTGFSGMGSLSQRTQGSIANALSGDPWTPQMVEDIKSFGASQAQVAQDNLSRGIDNTNKLYNTNVGQGLKPTVPGAAQGFTRIKASDGSMHDIPSANIAAARKIDPGLQVQQ
jgi:hypothetical protein